ncbi:MAG: hypothetical protein HDT43_00420 [Ruminococcaceae bacterium]|nr:hypothetical protein [Oscillospiraceae bacterium]
MNAVAFNNQRYTMPNIAPNKRNSSAKVEIFSRLSENAEPVRIYSEDELKDMCVQSVYSRLPMDKVMSMDNIDEIRKAIKGGAMFILLGANEASTFMNDVEKALADGKSFEDALKAQQEKHYSDRFRTDRFDEFLIDPKTGAVIDSYSASRGLIIDDTNITVDYPTCKAIADDLATFIRYTAFPQKGDDPEKVDQLIGWLKEKQSGYDISRFDPANDWRNPELQAMAKRLAAAYNDDDFSLEDDDKSIDKLLELIRKMQDAQRDDNTGLSLTEIIRSMVGIEKESIVDARDKLKADFNLKFSL